jgi:hypothetical protein
MNRIWVTALAALALVALPAQGAEAPEPDVEAILSVMGYGYSVRVLVNGADTGVQGGKSESKRLFGKNHPMIAQAAPAIRARHFLLVPGANEIAIEYSKVDAKTSDRLEITLEADGYPKPLLQLVNRHKASDQLSVRVQIEKAAPSGFKPVLIGEAK